jgi:hypothetical protein
MLSEGTLNVKNEESRIKSRRTRIFKAESASDF